MRVGALPFGMVSLLLCGCASTGADLHRETARQLNVSPDEVTVADVHRDATGIDWMALTPEGNFRCYADDMVSRVNCQHQQKPEATSAGTATGSSQRAEEDSTVNAATPRDSKTDKEGPSTVATTPGVSQDVKENLTAMTLVVSVHQGKLRSKPFRRSHVLRTLKKGEEAKVLEQKQSWYFVKTADGKTGWCHKSIVREKTATGE